MFTLGAFWASMANGSVYSAVAAVLDPILTKSQTGNFILPRKMKARLGYVQGVNLSAAQVAAPSLRNMALPEVYPTVVAAAPPTIPGINVWGDYGPTIQALEELGINISRAGADAQPVTAGLWLFDGFTPVGPGPMTTLVATSTIVQVAGSWTQGALTFATIPTAGRYTVIGMNVVANDVAFARLIFPLNQTSRPGCLVDAAYGNKIIPNHFGPGMLGKWGEFDSTALPGIETLGLVAGSEPVTTYLHCIKTG